jgi:hypothetical protein
VKEWEEEQADLFTIVGIIYAKQKVQEVMCVCPFVLYLVSA